ncbi:hypothetical protein As57867_007181, partial [Aphanomyces stellatus]
MSSAVAVLDQAPLVSILADYQEGVHGDVQPRFTERFDTVLLNDRSQLLPPTAFPRLKPDNVPASSDGLRLLQGLYLSTTYRDRRFPLHMAIFEGDVVATTRILSSHPAFLTSDALYCAVHHRRLAIVQLLLPRLRSILSASGSTDVHVFSRMYRQHALLDICADQNDLPTLTCLHDAGIDDCTSRAMNSAARHGNLPMMRFLHARRPDVGCSYVALADAVKHGHTDVVAFLLAHYPDVVDHKFDVTLWRAVSTGRLDILQMLVARRPNAVPPADLFCAAATDGQLHVMQWLHATTGERGTW